MNNKIQIYDELSKVLTEAKEYWRTNNDTMLGCENELYSMLVKIQNNWEDITVKDNKKAINIGLTYEDLDDLMQDKAFDCTFDDVDVHLYNEDENPN